MAEAFVFAVTLTLLVSLIIPSSAINNDGPKQEEILGMVRDMQIANYFTFATLINMVQTSVPGNTTFFVPDDRSLSKIIIQQKHVFQFLLRHSVPSLLPFAELSHLPEGTALPSNQPPYMIKISDDNKGLYLNNVKLISPDICKSGASFRCHGITGVFMPDTIKTPPPPKQALEHHAPPPPPPPPPPPIIAPPSAPVPAAPPAQAAPVSSPAPLPTPPSTAPTTMSSSAGLPSRSSNMLHRAGSLLFPTIFVLLVQFLY